ncbi:hypothetical protein A8F94_02755 [Bacillus sp. FJAT-27225]|uniref:hypothetical protein n=1 Tax=Bacillus sp. FJAT-27225 TaxID=1743144 RepID=UPI00080C2A8C|nr:hypothetical protein [Bacillus sp. FJAT-27225]OCA90812.1 hypothetical protein A8F94_02755 [Bacillus sp. FJAT-27225]
MNISDYYGESAKALLNSSLLFLLPAFLLVILNIAYIGNSKIMLFCLPFIGTSLVYFQIHLMKAKHAEAAGTGYHGVNVPLQEARSMLVLYSNHVSPTILLFSPAGVKIGEIMKRKRTLKHILTSRKEFELCDQDKLPLAVYSVSRGKIDSFDEKGLYLGSLIDSRNEAARLLQAGIETSSPLYVSGSRFFMDVKVEAGTEQHCARLRRGMMPLEWEARFPDPNTPVFTLDDSAAPNERLLYFSVLVQEFFIER